MPMQGIVIKVLCNLPAVLAFLVVVVCYFGRLALSAFCLTSYDWVVLSASMEYMKKIYYQLLPSSQL